MRDAKTKKTAPDPELTKPHSHSHSPQRHLFLNSLIRTLFQKGDSPWGLLAAGLLITVVVTLFMKVNVDHNAEEEFNHQSHEIQFAVVERLHDQARILKSGVALFETSDNITLQKWTAFTRYLAIEKELHGLLGLGFSLYIRPDELKQHLQQIRSEGFPHYRLVPEGVRTDYSSVIHIEPLSSGTKQSFGFDMLTDPIRRAAMEQARDTNLAMLSGIVPLLKESGSDDQSGVLMFLPVYHQGMPVQTVAQRRAAIHGWVFHPCRMDDMMKGVLGDVILKEAQQLRLQIFDGAHPSPQSMFYECVPPDERNLAAAARFSHQIPLVFNGHTWTLQFTKTDKGYFNQEYLKVWIILVAGIAINLLLFTLIRALLIIRTETKKIAEILTLDLRNSEQFTTDILNSLPSNIAVLDSDGVIISVNNRWRDFAVENSGNCTPECDLGKRYFDVFENIEETEDDANIEEIREGLRAVLQGELDHFVSEYPCHAPDLQRWYLMSATHLSGPLRGVVVSHTDITDRKRAEFELAKILAELDERVAIRTFDLTRSNELLKHEIIEREMMEESLQLAYEEISGLKDRLQAENIYLEKQVAEHHNFGDFIGQSRQLTTLFDLIKQVAPMNTTVLILGETGTGKGVVARAIHSHSARKDRPMITVNCTALPTNLIESELFGRERGAFTGANARQMGRFELANGGTIFLDEIGDMALELQSKLLRVIQDGEFELLGSPRTIKVDVRIIAATNRNLVEEIRKGTFRQDLYYRLNVFPLTIPPLRERKEDIPLLVKHFVAKFNKKNGKAIETVSRETLNNLQEYHWPGNVRELESFIERAVIISEWTELRIWDRQDTVQKTVAAPEQGVKGIDELERSHIFEVLQKTGWRINGAKGAAALLGINPSTLRSRIKKLGIVRQ